MKKTTDISELFEQGGGLSDTLSHFELRSGQLELVKAIEKTLDKQQHLLAEAGTGIGKTFAYLLPSLGKNKKVFVSTATKHLQEQIFFKDLPIIEKVLNRGISACLLKGRSNYLCHYRFEEFFQSSLGFNQKLGKKIRVIKDWSEKTLSGDLSEVTVFSEEDIGLQRRITSNTDNCLAKECPYFSDCFVQKAREKAKQSELVIVNHALLMADIVLKETGFAEILPEVDVVIIDEAHHLPQTATQAFAEQITSGQLIDLARDIKQTYIAQANDIQGFDEIVDEVIKCINDFCQCLSVEQSSGQILLSELKQMPNVHQAFKAMMQALKPLLDNMVLLAERGEKFSALNARALAIAAKIRQVFAVPKKIDDSPITDSQPHDAQTAAIAVESSEKASASVALLEWGQNYFRASRLPITLDKRFELAMNYYADSWLFVSATLALGDSFSHFKRALGLNQDMISLQVQSPFDYENQCAVHVAQSLPFPNHQTFIQSLVDYSLPILKKTRGRAFMLFSSYKNLNEATQLMQDSGFKLLVQGDLPKSQLIDVFIKSDNAVLLGTLSFWEGVDVHGEKLCCVIIDKIPFPSPADPLISEQTRYLQGLGKNAFACCYLPKAATLLKQGAGRLIRSQRDKGILIFGDNRLISKSYGKQLLDCLPPAKSVDRKGLTAFIEKHL